MQGVFYGIMASFFVALNAIYTKKSLNAVDNNIWKLAVVQVQSRKAAPYVLSTKPVANLVCDILICSVLKTSTGRVGRLPAWKFCFPATQRHGTVVSRKEFSYCFKAKSAFDSVSIAG